MSANRNRESAGALLALGDGQEAWITSEEALSEALRALPLVESGRTVSLARGAKTYVRATREGNYRSAVPWLGGWWTLGAFTADMTSEYSALQVRESRAAGSLWKRLAPTFASASPEVELSTD